MDNSTINFYSHKKEHGYMSNFYGVTQDDEFDLILPLNTDVGQLNEKTFDLSSGDVADFSTSEHAYQIQKFMCFSENNELVEKCKEYREIMKWLLNPNDVAAMGRQKAPASSTYPKLISGAPKWIRDKCKETLLIDIILEYKKAGVVIRDDWDSVKDKIMYFVVFQKFSQNLHLKKLLKETGNVTLVENTKNDSYWANGPDGKGLNKLGLILMDVRKNIC